MLSQTNVRAFVQQDQIRLDCTDGARRWMFKAAWEHSRGKAQEFSYASATLEASDPKPVPEAASRWREVTVLSKAESERCLRRVVGRLAPAEPGQGTHFQFALGDAVLFRNAAG